MDKIQKRFNKLEIDARAILGNKTTRTGCIDYPVVASSPSPTPPQIPDIDRNALTEWQTSVLTLLDRVFGRDSTTFEYFNKKICNPPSGYNDNYVEFFEQLHAIFLSAKSDFEGGYLFDVKNLVHAEVFSNELEQAEHFLNAGYKTPAAVITGVVLETPLRKLCEQTDGVEPAGKINKMNDDLAKASAYNKMRHKQITAWANIRNDAAHGKIDEFDEGDVNRMIEGVRDFVAAQLS